MQATIADHITPHRGDTRLFFDRGNLQSLCKQCHDSTKQRIEHGEQVAFTGLDGMPTDPAHPWNVLPAHVQATAPAASAPLSSSLPLSSSVLRRNRGDDRKSGDGAQAAPSDPSCTETLTGADHPTDGHRVAGAVLEAETPQGGAPEPVSACDALRKPVPCSRGGHCPDIDACETAMGCLMLSRPEPRMCSSCHQLFYPRHSHAAIVCQRCSRKGGM